MPLATIFGSHFEYAGISSRQYGLIIASVDTEEYRAIAGTMSGHLVYDKKNNKQSIVGNDYSEPLSFEVNIISDNGFAPDYFDRREIEKWLFNRSTFKKFYLDMTDDIYGESYEVIDGEQKRLYLNCRFINAERLYYNGGIIGYRATLEADGPMWWQDTISKTFTIVDRPSYVTVTVDSDISDYIYPVVKFITRGTLVDDGSVYIKNNSDGSGGTTAFEHLSTNSLITIDSVHNFVSGQHYLNMNQKNFPRLLDGENIIRVSGDIASITFEFNNRRFL